MCPDGTLSLVGCMTLVQSLSLPYFGFFISKNKGKKNTELPAPSGDDHKDHIIDHVSLYLTVYELWVGKA